MSQPLRRTTVRACIRSWLASRLGRLGPATWADYRDKAERYLTPYLGRIPLHRLDSGRLLRYYRQLEDRGLSPRTVSYAHQILVQVLHHAVDQGLIGSNPARETRPTPCKRRSGTRLTPDQLRRFLRVARRDEFAALWMLLGATGVRPGEALALRWEDLDLVRGVARVAHVLRSLPGGRWERHPLRYAGQVREVALPKDVVRALEAHLRRQEWLRSAPGASWPSGDLVFTNRDGAPVYWSNLAHTRFKALLREAGLPDVPGYSLRHAYVATLIAGGLDIRQVTRLTGYTDLSQVGRSLPSHPVDQPN